MTLLERALSGLIGLAIKSKAWFVVTSIGIPSSALGIWWSDNTRYIFLSQKKYIGEVYTEERCWKLHPELNPKNKKKDNKNNNLMATNSSNQVERISDEDENIVCTSV